MFSDIINRITSQKKQFEESVLLGSIDSYEVYRYHRGVLMGLDLALQAIEDYQKEMTRLNNDDN
jgi:hypothetical protein